MGITPTRIGDSGGERITITGAWAVDVAHAVTVGGVAALLIGGSSGSALPNAAGDLVVLTPAGLALGVAEVLVTPDGAPAVDAGDVTVVRRYRETEVAELARLFPYEHYKALEVDRALRGKSGLGDWSPLPALDGLVDTLGGGLNRVGGQLYTRLTTQLPAALLGAEPVDDSHLTAAVESTLPFADGDEVLIGDEVVTIGTVSDGTTLTGLVRDDTRREPHPAGTPVILARATSGLALARASLDIRLATGDALAAIGSAHGVPRLDLPDEAYRGLVRHVAWGRGIASRSFLERLLDIILPICLASSGSVDGDALTDDSEPFAAGMVDLRVEIDGLRYRIAEVVGPGEVRLDALRGDQWLPADFEAADVDYNIVPYDMLSGPGRPAVAHVRINCAGALTAVGATFLNSSTHPDGVALAFDVGSQRMQADVGHPIRQVLGAYRWQFGRASYATANEFSGDVAILDDLQTFNADAVLQLVDGTATIPGGFDPNDPGGTSHASYSFVLLDAGNVRRDTTLYITCTAGDPGVLPSNWEANLVIDGEFLDGGVMGTPQAIPCGDLTFDGAGALLNQINTVASIPWANGADSSVTFDYTGSEIDAFAGNTVSSFEIDSATGLLEVVVELLDSTPPIGPFDPYDPNSTANATAAVTLVDAGGVVHPAAIYVGCAAGDPFVTTSRWDVHLLVDGDDLAGGEAGIKHAFFVGQLVFLPDGSLFELVGGWVTVPWSDGAVEIEFDFTGSTVSDLHAGNAIASVAKSPAAIPDPALIHHGWIEEPLATSTGIPGSATGPGTAQLLADNTESNPDGDDDPWYPFYISPNLGVSFRDALAAILRPYVAAGVDILITRIIW